jgi:hypothetical protein
MVDDRHGLGCADTGTQIGTGGRGSTVPSLPLRDCPGGGCVMMSDCRGCDDDPASGRQSHSRRSSSRSLAGICQPAAELLDRVLVPDQEHLPGAAHLRAEAVAGLDPSLVEGIDGQRDLVLRAHAGVPTAAPVLYNWLHESRLAERRRRARAWSPPSDRRRPTHHPKRFATNASGDADGATRPLGGVDATAGLPPGISLV